MNNELLLILLLASFPFYLTAQLTGYAAVTYGKIRPFRIPLTTSAFIFTLIMSHFLKAAPNPSIKP
ncbi:MAG: hypothetical protein AAFZ15_14355 [Bacteroidota bacterium]